MSTTKESLASFQLTGHLEYLKCLIVSDTKKGGLHGIVTMGTINSQFCPGDPILMIS